MATIRNVLVTGGSGKVGRYVVADLREHGYEVTTAQKEPSAGHNAFQADLTDLGQAYGLLAGKDAVVHLAAIPWPGANPPEVVYANNVLSTFNILQACSVLGIKKVVMAGSESALGFPFRFRPFSPLYLPIDEDHPLLAQDAYGLAKINAEELGRGFVRRDPTMSVTTLRFSYVQEPHDYAQLLRSAWSDPSANSFNLWCYVDARDTASACRLAIEYQEPGYEALYVAAPDTVMREPTLELVARSFPGVQRIAEGFGGRMSPLDCRKAQEMLGWQAQYTWDRIVDASHVDLTPLEG